MTYLKALIKVLVVFICFRLNAQSLDVQVEQIVAGLTLDEKIGQMTQVERKSLMSINDIATYNIGSLLSGGGSAPTPNTLSSWISMYNEFQAIALQSSSEIPLIYGIDAVHGHSNVYGAVILPHNIGLGATWNPQLVEDVNKIVAKEVAATGIDWTFAPCIAVARNERWGRTYEGFGEHVDEQKIMAKASVLGLQGTDLSAEETILACAKHYVGDGATSDGIDQGNAEISEAELRALHLPGYIEAINEGLGTIMASFSSWNGQKLHGYKYLLTDVLKEELGFDGFILSDWQGVDQVHPNYRTAIKNSINAGVDMVMVPHQYITFINHLRDLVNNNEVSMERVDDAVKRIIKQKIKLGLFESPYASTSSSLVDDFGSDSHRAIVRQSVRESLVLLDAKHDVLPISKDNQNIGVAGTLANDLGGQCGGWTITWQGGNGNITEGTTILQGIQSHANSSNVTYSKTGDFPQGTEVAVVVIGEKTPYAEGSGDRFAVGIEYEDVELVKKIKNQGIKTIVVLVSGRPLVLGELLPYSDAIIAAWYPGTEGDGVAEVLYGDFPFSGKLTHSWPNHMRQVPINIGDEQYNPLYEYKHGLNYFPSSSSTTTLEAYAAKTTANGTSIQIYFKDDISTINLTQSDISISGIQPNNQVESFNVSAEDSSILNLSLLQEVSEVDELYVSIAPNTIFSNNLALGNLSNLFVFNAVVNAASNGSIPGKIEAEDFALNSGTQTEICSDVGGGLNIGYVEAEDSLIYDITVGETGFYDIRARLSGYASGYYEIYVNDLLKTVTNYQGTNGWQNWENFFDKIYLEEGNHELKVLFKSDEVNVNYFDFTFDRKNHAVPGKIEAEEFSKSFGLTTEPTLDTGGGKSLGFLNNGDTAYYPISVLQGGNFKITARVASTAQGSFKLTFNNTEDYYFDVDNTQGFQSWADVTKNVFLNSGVQELMLTAITEGININYFNFEFSGSFSTTNEISQQDIVIYPLPAEKTLRVKIPSSVKRVEKLILYSTNGQVIETIENIIPDSSGVFTIDINHNGQKQLLVSFELDSDIFLKKIIVK